MTFSGNAALRIEETPQENEQFFSGNRTDGEPGKERVLATVSLPGGSPAEAGTKRKPALFLSVAIAMCAGYVCAGQVAAIPALMGQSVMERVFVLLLLTLLTLSAAELIWRAVLALRYRPVRGCEDAFLPGCTVVVPAYNEGKQVLVTLLSLAASNYPKGKLRLIAVDDGSVDDTWEWIRKAKDLLGDRVLAIRLPRNQGKRHALCAGFRQSGDEILITVDSDSIVEADTLRNLVAPFVSDARVGAVAGNVRVLNLDRGIIPRMLDVVFVYSFDFIRASQSMVKAVMCTPGALSAYRRDVVIGLLPEWLSQSFCGQPANIGEDRALTNMILREGHHVLFQQNAKVYTEVPVCYSDLCKMYLRWARGDVRETIAMSRFIFTPFRAGSMLGARINLLASWVAVTKINIIFLIVLGMIVLHPATLGINTAVGVVLSSSLAAVIYAWKFGSFSSLWALVYGFYSFLLLSWIQPYALITSHKSGWLTRQIKKGPAVRQQASSITGKVLLHSVKGVE